MTTSNPVITHLKQNSSRISRMLSVGQKSSQAQTAGDFSPVASNFGGQKFQLAAQKMRILDLQKMGRNLPGQKQNPQLGTQIQARFADSAKLLHLSARPPGSDENWARVDMVYPSPNPVERPRVPDDPGILRQGSVIPKFSTFPAPGQTAESFKAQVQREAPNRIVSTRKPTTPPPARISPRDRLFSRVQEMTPDSKEPEKPVTGAVEAETKTADIAETAKSPSPSIPAAGDGPAVQRQADPVAAQPKPAKDSLPPELAQFSPQEKPTKAEEKSAPASQPPGGGPAVQRQADPAATQPKPAEAGKIARESLEPAAESTVEGQPLPVLPHPETVGPVTPVRQSLPQAKPVQKKSQAESVSSLPLARSTRAFKTAKQLESAAKRLPIARPTSVSDSSISSQTIVQRQAGMSLSKSSAQPTRRLVEMRPQTAGSTRQSAEGETVSAPASTPDRTSASSESGPVQEVERPTAQPLHQRFEYRRLVSSQLKAIQPAESFVTPRANPLVNRTDQPLIASYQHFSSEGQAVPSSSGERTFLSPPTMLGLARSAPQRSQDRLDLRQPESRPFFDSQKKSEPPQAALRSFSTLDLAAQPNPMELARTDQAPILDTAHSPASLSNERNPSLLEMKKPPITNRAIVPTGESLAASKSGPSNVVQRVWEQHTEPEDIKPEPGPSVEELAEKILPLVKRMMAVEIERSGSLFR